MKTLLASLICFALAVSADAALLSADAAIAAFTNGIMAVKVVDGDKTTFFVAQEASNTITRIAYLKVAKGYKGKITLFAIARNDGTNIVFDSIQIVDGKHKYKERTNGQEGNYMKQFAGKPATKDTKEMKLAVDSISGSSVTARSIKRAIDSERNNLIRLFGGKK